MLRKHIIFSCFIAILAIILTPWFTNNRNIIINQEIENNFQKDAEVLVVSRIAAEVSNVDTNFYNLGRLGPETKTPLNTWGNPDPYQALNEKSAKDFMPYISQYGIHSGIYSYIYPKLILISNNVFNLTDLRFIITLLFVFINLLIFINLYKKVDKILGLIWIISILFAPFVLLFARNIYWSSFSFFLPILISIYYSVSPKNKSLILIVLNLALLFRFLIGYEFYTTLILTCTFFCVINIMNQKYFKITKNFLKLFGKILSSFIGTFFVSINIHSFLSPMGYKSTLNYLLNRSNSRLANAETPISNIISTIESYFFEWPKFFGWPVWYSENNIFSFPLPNLKIISIPGKFFIVIMIYLIILLITSSINKKIFENKMHLLLFILGPISWIILYPSHENEHGFDFYLMYFGSIQMIIYVIYWNIEKIIKYNLTSLLQSYLTKK